MSNQERWPPARVNYVGDDVIEMPMSRADAVGLHCVYCGHAPRVHVSSNGWPGPYICKAAEGCDCKRHGEELRWAGVAQAPNAGSEQVTGSGAYTGMTASNLWSFRNNQRPDFIITGSLTDEGSWLKQLWHWLLKRPSSPAFRTIPVRNDWERHWHELMTGQESEQTRHERVLAEIAERHKVAKRFAHEMSFWPSPVECFIAELAGVNLEKVFEMIRTRGYLPGSIRAALGNLAGVYA